MPAKSAKQQRFMGMCAHSDKGGEKCPPKKVAEEFSHKPAGGYTSKVHEDMAKEYMGKKGRRI